MRITLPKLLAALALAMCLACGDRPSDEDVLQKLAPSMVTIQFRERDIGSGFLVEGNYVATAAHVVWGFPEIDVVFSDGSVRGDAPILGYDHFADLAFLGPFDTTAPHVAFADADSLAAGDSVFNVGFAKGLGRLSFTKGEITRTLVWPEADVTLVYSTTEARPGMSGGLTANDRGEVVSVISLGDETVSIGPTMETVKDRLGKIARGEPISVLGSREPPDVRDGSREHQFVLRDRWDTETLVLEGARKGVDFDAHRDVEYALFDVNGKGDLSPPFRPVQESLSNLYGPTAACCIGGTGFIEIRQRFDIERHVALKSLTPLVRRDDPDDGRQLRIGDTVAGAIDTPGDIDRYTILLSQGESIGIRMSARRRLSVTIEHANAPPYDVVTGTVHFDEIKFRAPVEATYTVAIQIDPESFGHPLGYTLTVSEATVEPNRRGPYPRFHTPVGEVLRHIFHNGLPRIQIEYPANVTGGNREEIATDFFEQDRWGRTVALEESALGHHRRRPDEELTVHTYMNRSALSNALPYKGLKLITARREIETQAGGPILIEEFEADNGGMKGVRLAYVHEGETGYMAIFYAPGEVFDKWRPVVDYCIGAFSIGDFSVADAMADR